MSKIKTALHKFLKDYATTWSLLRLPGKVCLVIITIIFVIQPIMLTVLDSPIIKDAISEHKISTLIAVIASCISYGFIWFIYTIRLILILAAASTVFIVLTMIVYGASLGKINLFKIFFTQEGIDHMGVVMQKLRESS